MDIAQVKEELSRLRKEIKRHNKKYYELDAPEISDYEYDKLMTRLKELEAAYPEFITPTSPTQTVGGSAKREAGKLVAHDVPMLSLQDVFNRTDVENFIAPENFSPADFEPLSHEDFNPADFEPIISSADYK